MTAGLIDLERGRVEHFLRVWERLFDEADAHTMAAYYAEDAELIAADSETLRGRGRIEEFFTSATKGASAGGVRRTVHLGEVASVGDLGYIRGHVLLERPDTAEPVRVRYVTLWKRQRDGMWRLAVDISTPAPAPHTRSER